jgi:hypothetical protein
MLKIKDSSKWQEKAITKSEREARKAAGLSEDPVIDHFQLRSFRVDLFPIPIVEINLAYCDAEGNAIDSTYQFFMRGADAERFINRGKFEKFAEHLEEIAAESSKPEHKALQDKRQACGIECEVKAKVVNIE